MSKQTFQKKDDPKKVEEKNERKFFSTYITEITPTNALSYVSPKGKKQRMTMSLAYVDVPRYDKIQKKEECFAYECGEYLRKKLITGKLVKFEVIQEVDGEAKAVVPIVGKENIIISLLEKGYVVLKQYTKAPEMYVETEKKAKENKVGVHSDNATEIAKKKPEHVYMNELESKALEGKTVTGHIQRIEAPAVYHIETSDRKVFIINLYGVNQMLRFNTQKRRWDLDEDGEVAMEHCNKYFNKRDVTVEVKNAANGRLYGIIKQEKKDIAEDLLKNGFVVCARVEGIPESVKQLYEKAEKEAKKNQRARWTEFDQKAEDELIAKREERQRQLEERKKNCKVITGAEVKRIAKSIEIQKDGENIHVNLASVRLISKKGNEKYNELVQFRIKEAIRKQIIGKAFQCKEAYRETIKINDKDVEQVYYDVYAGGKNICLNLFKEGLVTLVRERDEFKRSFDYEKFEEIAKENHKYVEKQVHFVEKEEKIKNKDVYLNTVMSCVLETIISPVKFIIYNAEKDIRMRVALKGCRVPRDDENAELKQFMKEAKKFIRQNVGLNEVTVDFKEYERGEFLCDIYAKKFDFASQLINEGYVCFVGYEAPNETVEKMKEDGEKIYKFQPARKPRENEEAKPVVQRPKREVVREMKFDEGKKVVICGYDGSDIYYYETAEDMKFLENLQKQMKALPKGKINDKVGEIVVVDVKGTFHRAQIIDPVQGAFVLKCIDTGAIIICGKNKLKPITEEVKEVVAPKKMEQITLVGIKTPVRGKHTEYAISINAVSQFYGKEATLFTTILGEKAYAKVYVGEECINLMLVAEGLSILNKSFKDSSEWGQAMKTAEVSAKEKHLNMWKYGEVYDEEDKDQK